MSAVKANNAQRKATSANVALKRHVRAGYMLALDEAAAWAQSAQAAGAKGVSKWSLDVEKGDCLDNAEASIDRARRIDCFLSEL